LTRLIATINPQVTKKPTTRLRPRAMEASLIV
jgi:hypothetical protein